MLRRILLPACLLLVALCAGMWLGGHPNQLPTGLRNTFVDKQTAVVGNALGVLDSRYYRKIPNRTVEDAALTAAVRSLGDQYSNYLSPQSLVSFNEVTDAKFSGIGVGVLPAPTGLKISHVYDNSPAKTAGLKTGDIITGAGKKSLKGLTATAASALIKGPTGTAVALTIQRGKQTIHVSVKRAEVQIPVVESHYDKAAKVGVVRLGSFSTGAAAEVEKGVQQMQKDGATGIVLDLRDNPGGLVDEAQKLASLFLKGGTVVTTRGRSVKTNTLKAGDHPQFPNLPLVVLVDGNSASAAEIVTGALQDRGRAKVVGTHTYGKGVFQEVIPLSEGGAMDITVGQYYTPNGHNLGGAGVTAGKDVSRGGGIKPNITAVDNPKTPKVDEAEQTAIDAVKQP